MAPRQKGKKKTARSSDGDNEEGIDPKRQCTTSTRTTTSTTTSVSVKKEEEEVKVAGGNNISNNSLVKQAAIPDSVVSATEPNSTITTATTSDDDDDDDELPTPVKLSEELCKIVSPRYSRVEACRALRKLYKWGYTEDSEFLKSFYMYAGIIKVIDFLKGTMNDSSCVGTVRMECIEKAASVITIVSYPGEDDSNSEIVTKIIASTIGHDVIGTLLSASDEYSGGNVVSQLKALDRVWAAMGNIIARDNVNSQDKMIISFEACIDILSQLKLYDGPIVSSILRRVFNILFYIITKSHVVDKKHFQNENIFSKCLDVFRKDGIWGDRNEAITDAAIDLFDCCRIRKLLEDSDDYEMILPFLAVGVKKFGSNQHSNEILANTLTLIHKACGSIQDKKIIERSGVMESLSVLLASNDIDEDQKKKIRKVIVKIAAP